MTYGKLIKVVIFDLRACYSRCIRINTQSYRVSLIFGLSNVCEEPPAVGTLAWITHYIASTMTIGFDAKVQRSDPRGCKLYWKCY